MNPCPTCGQPVNKSPVYLDNAKRGIVIDGQEIALTRREFVIAEMLYNAMGRENVHLDNLLIALYDLQEPASAEGIMRKFIFRFRQKLSGTNLSIINYSPRRYGFVYEARKAA